MTTIAYRDGILAGDGRVTEIEERESSYVLHDNDIKVFKLKDGRLYGGSRSSEDILRLYYSLVNNTPPPKLEDINALLVDTKGKLYLYEGHLWQPLSDLYYAVGSGSRFAFPALDAGATAIEAVKIGIKRDPYSGGKITVVRLNYGKVRKSH